MLVSAHLQLEVFKSWSYEVIKHNEKVSVADN